MEGLAEGGEVWGLLLRCESGKARLEVEVRSRAGGFEVLRFRSQLSDTKFLGVYLG